MVIKINEYQQPNFLGQLQPLQHPGIVGAPTPMEKLQAELLKKAMQTVFSSTLPHLNGNSRHIERLKVLIEKGDYGSALYAAQMAVLRANSIALLMSPKVGESLQKYLEAAGYFFLTQDPNEELAMVPAERSERTRAVWVYVNDLIANNYVTVLGNVYMGDTEQEAMTLLRLGYA